MNKTVALPITCSCKDKRAFIHSVQLEHSKNKSIVVSMQIDCPFSYEKNCMRHLTIQLPPGMKPNNNDSLLRG